MGTIKIKNKAVDRFGSTVCSTIQHYNIPNKA
jgi:hypothetical protein